MLFALCTLLPGPTPPALAQDGAPAPAGPSARGTPSQPPVRGTPDAPAAGAHQQEDSQDVAPPEHEEVPEATDPYARDPYENEPSGDEGGTVEDVNPNLDEPSAGTREPDIPDAADGDGDDTEPDDAAGE